MVDIHVLTADDAEAFRAVRIRATADHPEAFHSGPDEWRAHPAEAIRARLGEHPTVAAFVDGCIVAVASLARVRAQAKRRHRAEIWNVYVDPTYRGQGLVERVLEQLFQIAREQGLDSVILTVATSNAPAIRVYERMGFTTYGTEPGATRLPDGRPVDEHLMIKWL